MFLTSHFANSALPFILFTVFLHYRLTQPSISTGSQRIREFLTPRDFQTPCPDQGHLYFIVPMLYRLANMSHAVHDLILKT